MFGSKRQQKFSRLILKEIGDIFQKESYRLFGNKFLTVSEVRMTPDLREARVYVSMSFVKNKEETLEEIYQHKNEIRGILGNRIGKQVRAIPDLVFFIDEIPEQAARIHKILDNLDIPPAEDDDVP